MTPSSSDSIELSLSCEHCLYLWHLLAFNAYRPELLGTSLTFFISLDQHLTSMTIDRHTSCSPLLFTLVTSDTSAPVIYWSFPDILCCWLHHRWGCFTEDLPGTTWTGERGINLRDPKLTGGGTIEVTALPNTSEHPGEGDSIGTWVIIWTISRGASDTTTTIHKKGAEQTA